MKIRLFGFYLKLDQDGFDCGWDKNDRRVDIPFYLIIAAFILFWPAGLILLILQLSQEDKKGKKHTGRQATGAGQHRAASAAEGSAAAEPQRAARAQKSTSQKAKRRPGKIRGGKALWIVGLVMMAVFGIATVSGAVSNWYLLSRYPMWLLEEVLPPFLMTGVGAGLFTWGMFRGRRARRFRRFLSLIGEEDVIPVRALADAVPTSYAAAMRTLQDMIDQEILPAGAYLDRVGGRLVLSGEGIHSAPAEEKAPPESEREEDDWLRQIREVNDAIAHEALSRKIDRIGEITQNILAYQREHPDKAPELRKFLRYYLPTTLKILNAYAELEKQGVEGENISATKQRIESMMDMVVEGFEKQLDQLFAGDMMDIAADITVMERMMKNDGLFQAEENDGMPGLRAGGR